jgi:ABC-type antimicrobial peptide transport system permease subunit
LTWNLFAAQLGVAAPAGTPPLAVLLTVPVAVLAANLVAAVPARSAARTQPALILRSE